MSVIKCPSCGQPVNVPEKKTGLWWGIGCLIAALGLPVIVAVVGLLAAIAIPSFMKARETSQRIACTSNMHVIEQAKEQVAAAHSSRPGEVLPEQQVSESMPRGISGVVCPKGGTYTINPVGQDPSCSVHGSMSDAASRR